jgi:hypothetical protein
MDINELLGIIDSNGGSAKTDDFADYYRNKYCMGVDSSFRSAIKQVLLANPDKVVYNALIDVWERGCNQNHSSAYLRVSDEKRFGQIKDIMRELFGFSKVKSQCGYFSLNDKQAVWFPRFDNKEWDNQLSDDGKHWYERPRDGRKTDKETKLRFIFEFKKFGKGKKQYRFTGVFEAEDIRPDGTRPFKIIDDKILIKGKPLDLSNFRKMLICNVSYMKYYNGITDDDKIESGGGSYPTENKDGGEKFNFRVREDGTIKGFVETNYSGEGAVVGDIKFANDIAIENIDSAFKGEESANGVRVVFISKGPNNDKNVVVGWYDNAIVYRKRQSLDSTFGFNLQCSKDDAHLIPDDQRDFAYPKKNPDETYNFGQINISYPYNSKQQTTIELADKLNEYIDKIKLRKESTDV